MTQERCENCKMIQIVYTQINLTDDKDWKHTIRHHGDFDCGNIYRIRKRLNDYEFKLVNKDFEEMDRKGKFVIKHLYFEMT